MAQILSFVHRSNRRLQAAARFVYSLLTQT